MPNFEFRATCDVTASPSFSLSRVSRTLFESYASKWYRYGSATLLVCRTNFVAGLGQADQQTLLVLVPHTRQGLALPPQDLRRTVAHQIIYSKRFTSGRTGTNIIVNFAQSGSKRYRWYRTRSRQNNTDSYAGRSMLPLFCINPGLLWTAGSLSFLCIRIWDRSWIRIQHKNNP